MYFIDNSAKTNWKFIGLVAVVAIAIGAGILIFSMQKEAPSQFPAITEPEAKPSEELAEELPTVETADWGTYRNEEFGFEFGYPSRTGGGVVEGKEIRLHSRSSFRFSIISHSDSLEAYVKNYLEKTPDTVVYNQYSTNVSGYPAIHLEAFHRSTRFPSLETFIMNDSQDIIVALQMIDREQPPTRERKVVDYLRPVYNLTLSTFRFIE